MRAKFKIGDMAFRPECGNKAVEKECPVCFAKREVIVVLGNGDSVTVRCDYCGKGYDGPRGYVTEQEYVIDAQPFVIDSIREFTTSKGAKVEYCDCHGYVMEEERLYTTKEEAMTAAVAEKVRLEKAQFERVDYMKKDATKNYSWNAGYHLRCVKQAQRDLDYHSKMAVLCKERAKK